MPTSDIERAKSLIEEGNTCALVCGEEEYVSQKRGVVPLLQFLDDGKDYSEFSAADKVVGKAAAMLYVRLNVKSIYAEVLSKSAVKVFQAAQKEYSYKAITQAVINRAGDGLCPMELAVMSIDDAVAAEKAIRETVKRLAAC